MAEVKMVDIKGSGMVEVLIDPTGTKLWINTGENGCVLRIQDIGRLELSDNRKKK